MVPQPSNASRCLNSLLRYELAAVRCYQFAEQVLGDGDDHDALTAVRRDHEATADHLRGLVVDAGQSPSCDPGLWGVLVTLVETSAAVFGRQSMLTVLLWIEQHAVETYESANRVRHLTDGNGPAVASECLPAVRRHIADLERVIGHYKDRASRPCADFVRPEFLGRSSALAAGTTC